MQFVFLAIVAFLPQLQGQRAPFPQRNTQRTVDFGQPHRCPPRNSLYNSGFQYPNRTHYTPRGTLDCCYDDDTRDSCCLASFYAHDNMAGYRLKYECRCDPAIKCNAPAPCPTMPPPTTTAPPTTETVAPGPSFCPYYGNPIDRALNGMPVTDKACLYKGLANVTLSLGGMGTLLCQAVYTTAVVNAQTSDVFVTADRCVESIRNLFGTVDFTLRFNAENHKLDAQNFDFVTGQNGAGYFVPKFVLPEAKSCQSNPACAYDSSSGMPPLETLTNCSLVSYGAINQQRQHSGLQEVPVKLSQTGCVPQIQFNQNVVTDGLCFASKSDQALYCTGDLGAPVYCKISETGDIVFIGNTAPHENCNTEPDILVIPFSG